MKSFFILSGLLLCMLEIHAQETYNVLPTNAYNIRTSPEIDSQIIGTTSGVSSLEVYEIKDNWAKIKYGDSIAYVKSQCLKEASNKSSLKQDYEKGSFMAEFCLVILSLIPLTLFFCLFKNKTDGYLSGFWFYLRWGVYVLLCFVESPLILLIGDGYLDGIINQEAGFGPGAAIVLIVGFFLTAIVQVKSYFEIMDDFKYNYDVDFNIYYGPISLAIGIVLTFLLVLLGFEYIFIFVLLLTILSQIIFIGIIFFKILKSKNILVALMCTGTYLIGCFSTLTLCSFLFFAIFMWKITKFCFTTMLGALAAGGRHHYY